MIDAITKAELLGILYDRCKTRGGAAEIAERGNTTPTQVSQVKCGYRDVTASIALGLGYREVKVYIPVKVRPE
jgi:hypothetical protein